MSRTMVFKSNRSQAVRLSKDVAFPDSVREVTVTRDGVRRIIAPTGNTWDDFFAERGIDLGGRDQPAVQERELL